MNETPETKFEQTFGQDLLQNSNVHLNLKQDVIITTEDKLRLCLRDAIDLLEIKKSWIAPVSLFLTIILVFATTKFHDNFIFDAATWRAIFAICGTGTFIWSIVAIKKAFNTTVTLDTIIFEVKKQAKNLEGK